jgi:uncharacterized membrane protein YhiD involved in acid resistance
VKIKLAITLLLVFLLLVGGALALSATGEGFVTRVAAASLESNIGSYLTDLFSGNSSTTEPPRPIFEKMLETVSRLLLAVILSGVLAMRPRRNIRLFRRNLYVSQTEILLSVVAAALMMIVGDNAARAFGIFAAVSIVRFRTNIRDPKEITVLLISLALGLAAGVGRWELGIALCLFALALLWLLEYREPERVFRHMELKVKARNIGKLQALLTDVFKRNKLDVEIREIDPPGAKKGVGSIIYYINMPLSISTDNLSQQIIDSSGEHLEGIEWIQEKRRQDIYD